MIHRFRKFLLSRATLPAIALALAGILLVLYAWRLPPFQSAIETTENAYVRGNVTIISPRVDGYVAEVPVQDFQRVQQGQLLVRIDDRNYRQRLAQAQANLAAARAALANAQQQRRSGEANVSLASAQIENAQAQLVRARADMRRVEQLVADGSLSQREADQTRAALAQAEAAVTQARAQAEIARQNLTATIVNRGSLEAAVEGAAAQVRLAEIDLQYARIAAPEAGRLGEVSVRLGQYVTPGTQLMTIVPARVWVIANFKEQQLAHMAEGQPATIAVDALEGAELRGHVERISPAAGSEFSVIRPDNATGNFTKVAQRIPVRIAIDPGQPLANRLRPGMSVVASVDTSGRGRAG